MPRESEPSPRVVIFAGPNGAGKSTQTDAILAALGIHHKAWAMKTAYDKATDSLYVHLTDKASVNSDEVTDGVVLDFDANGALVGIDVQKASQRVDVNNLTLQCSYAEQDDILHVRMSDKPIKREVSGNWNTHISYAADGTIVEIVLLDAKKKKL